LQNQHQNHRRYNKNVMVYFSFSSANLTTIVFLFDFLSDASSLILLRFKTPTLNNPMAIAGKKPIEIQLFEYKIHT
jgi:hypothetical protein